MTGNYSDPNKFIGTIDDEDLVFRTHNIERMRLTSAGNLGIGLTNPTFRLEVAGDSRFNGSLTFSNWNTTPTEPNRYVYAMPDGTLNYITQSQLYDQTLQAITSLDCKTLPGSPYPAPFWQSVAGASQNDPGKIFTGSSCPALVGIGTDSPVTLLHVNGRSYFASKVNIGEYAEANDARLRIKSNGHTGIELFTSETDELKRSFAVTHEETNLDVFKVWNSGAVEITCTNPTQVPFVISTTPDMVPSGPVFEVFANGNTFVTGLVVKNIPFFSDFVFDEGYGLMNLYELEKFVNANKHLPDVPSEKEIKTTGMNVRDLLVVLVQKVEELTLYTIAQQKEIDALKKLLATPHKN